MTVCTIDVHARDVVAKMITAKACEPRKGQGTGLGPSIRGFQPPLAHLPGEVTLLQAVATHPTPHIPGLESPLVSSQMSSPIRSTRSPARFSRGQC